MRRYTNYLPNRVVTITVARKSRKDFIMLELKVKDVRETFEETLTKFYAFPDFSVGSTKVMDKDKTFRIEFRIYDSEFWMNIEPAIYCVHIATRSFGEPDHLDMLHIWLRPYRYDKEHFTFGWRKDLECFFDTFEASLREKVERVRSASTSNAPEPNVKIGPLKEDLIMKNLEMEEAASYEEYVAEAKKADEAKKEKSVIAQCIDAIYGSPAKIGESKIGEAKIAGKPSIFNSLKDDEDEDVEW